MGAVKCHADNELRPALNRVPLNHNNLVICSVLTDGWTRAATGFPQTNLLCGFEHVHIPFTVSIYCVNIEESYVTAALVNIAGANRWRCCCS